MEQGFMTSCKQGKVSYTISKHARERYAERCAGKGTVVTVQAYVSEHEERIREDINKLLQYGLLMYTGKQKNEKNGDPIEVYVNGLWIILANAQTQNVITLYRVDLGCGPDLDKLYMERMIEKLKDARGSYETVRKDVEAQDSEYSDIICEGNEQIQEYRARIRKLEEMCEGYNTVIRNNQVRLEQAVDTMAEVANTLIGKKTF